MTTPVLGLATLGTPELEWSEVLALLGGDADPDATGITALEVRLADDQVLSAVSSVAEASAVGRDASAAGLGILALSGYVSLAAGDADAEAAALVHQLRLADAAQARGVRVFVGAPAGADRESTERRAASVITAAVHSTPGVRAKVLVETHDSHSRASDIIALLDRVPAEVRSRVGVIWDTAHTWCAGESLEDSFTALAPLLSHIQVKDVRSRDEPVPVALGEGVFPFEELRGVIAGAHVPVVLEWERTWHPELPAVSTQFARLVSLMRGIP